MSGTTRSRTRRTRRTRRTAEDADADEKRRSAAWPLEDRPAFAPWVLRTFKEEAGGADDGLFMQQRFVRDFLARDGPHRGLVLYHGLGSGKSCSAIAASEALRTAAAVFGGRTVRPTVWVMLPASLRGNYVREVRKCGALMFREDQRWTSLAVPPAAVATPASAKQRAAWAAAVAAMPPWAASWAAIVGDRAVARSVVAASSSARLWVPESALPQPESNPQSQSQQADAFRPFEQLSPEEQDRVRRQVAAAVAGTHRFVHYNGLTAKAAAELAADPRRFDDSVVVIDEAHNFVSNLTGGKLVGALYGALLGARRCKLLLLSGTPLVNEPEELAMLVNLAAGPVVVFRAPLSRRGMHEGDLERLRAHPRVRDAWEQLPGARGGSSGSSAGALCVRMAPDGFARPPGGRPGELARLPEGTLQLDDDAVEVRAVLAKTASRSLAPRALRDGDDDDDDDDKNGGGLERLELELLPSDPEAFRAAFVDEERNLLKNVDVLERRIAGFVSYYRGHDASLYPRERSIQMVLLPLSPRQFSEYTTLRSSERKREDAARRFEAARRNRGGARSGGDSSGVGMRPFSRAACTFVFPPGIPRPRRGAATATTMASADDEPGPDDAMEEGATDDEGDAATASTSAYSRALDAAIEKLRVASPPAPAPDLGTLPSAAGAQTAGDAAGSNTARRSRTSANPMRLGALRELSPKFEAITLRLLQMARGREGTAIVYSQFRRAEGVSILAVALEANGFVELAVSRASGSGSEAVAKREQEKGNSRKPPQQPHEQPLIATLRLGGRALTPAQLAADPSLRRRPRYMMYSNDDAAAAGAMLALFNNQASDAPLSVRQSALAALTGASAAAAAAAVPRPTKSKSKSKGSGATNLLGNLRGELATALLITRSGSEGISTRNVREVHIIEPFWHANRITQVIGRARRAHSHDDLPPEERTVDVRVYCAAFGPGQAKLHERDGGLTSDEHVHAVAQKKRVLLQQLLLAMRRAAVDCALWSKTNDADGREGCAAPYLAAPYLAEPSTTATATATATATRRSGSGSGSGLFVGGPPLFHPLLEEDLRAAAQRAARTAAAAKLSLVRRGGMLYYADLKAGLLYDYAAAKNEGRLIRVGQLPATATAATATATAAATAAASSSSPQAAAR